MFLKLTIVVIVVSYPMSKISTNNVPSVPNIIYIDSAKATAPSPRVSFKSAAESIKNLFANSIQSFTANQATNGEQQSPTRSVPGAPGVIVIGGGDSKKKSNNMIIVMPSRQSPAGTTASPETNLQSSVGAFGSHLQDRPNHEEISGSEQVPVGHEHPSFQGFSPAALAGHFQSFPSAQQYSPPISMEQYGQQFGQQYQPSESVSGQSGFQSPQPATGYAQQFQSVGSISGQNFQSVQPGNSFYRPPIVPSPGYPNRIIMGSDARLSSKEEESDDDNYEEEESKENEQTSGDDHKNENSDGGGDQYKMAMAMMKDKMMKDNQDKEMMKMMMKMSQGMMMMGKKKDDGGKSGSKSGDNGYGQGMEDMGKMEEEQDMTSGYGSSDDESGKGKGMEGGGGGCTEDDMKVIKEMMMMQAMMMTKMAGGGQAMKMKPDSKKAADMKKPMDGKKKDMAMTAKDMAMMKDMMMKAMAEMMMKRPSPCYKLPEIYPALLSLYPSPELYGHALPSYHPVPEPYTPPYPVVDHHHYHPTPVHPNPAPPYHPPIGYYSSNVPSSVKAPQNLNHQQGVMPMVQPMQHTPTPAKPCPVASHSHQVTNNQAPVSSAPRQTYQVETHTTTTTQPMADNNQKYNQYQQNQQPSKGDIPMYTAKSSPGQNQPPSNHLIDGVILEEDTPGRNGAQSWIIQTNADLFGNVQNPQAYEQKMPKGSSADDSNSFANPFATNSFFQQTSLLPSSSSLSSTSSQGSSNGQQVAKNNKKKYYKPPNHERMFIDKMTRGSLENNGKNKGSDSGSEEMIREVYSDTHRIEVIKRLGSSGSEREHDGNIVRQRALRGRK